MTVRLQRPDFMVWVKKALLFKGEEKADPPGSLPLAVDELTSNTTEAWAAGLLPAVPRPCMLAYAAAGSRLQVCTHEYAAVVAIGCRVWKSLDR